MTRITPARRDPTAFIGRAKELSQVSSWWSSEAGATLAGVGGSGKTRLAHRVLREISGGGKVCVVTDCTSEGDIVLALRDAIELPESGNTDDSTGIRGFAMQLSLCEPSLILLDGADAAVEPVASVLAHCLRHAPNIRFLVTSRETLAIRGERVLRLSPLNTSDALALFETRLRECGYTQTKLSTMVATAAVNAVDRLPLGIELIVFNATVQGQVIDEHWIPDLSLEDQGPRDLPKRQHSLWNAVAFLVASPTN